MSIKNSKFAKVTAMFAGFAMALALVAAPATADAALTQSQIAAIVSLLQSFGADAATVSNVQATLSGQPTSGTGTTGTTGSCAYTFSSNLTTGSTGTEVMNLQKVLNMDSATQVSTSGAGSPGNETSTFGPATKAAVIKFQNKYASEVLAPVGLSAGTGYVGASSRAKLNTICSGTATTGSGTTTGGTTTTIPGSGLSVTAAAQPSNSLAPYDAARIPFTKVNFTAANDGDVTVNSITVERTGLGADSVFAGVVLLDEAGIQLGIAKTLTSEHRTILTEPFVVKAGQTRTMTIGGNMAAQASIGAGSVVSLSVVSVSTSAAVSGSLPITGAQHTTNGTLAIGTAEMARGGQDPAQNASKDIGTTGYTFGSVKVTAGTAEKVYLDYIRWYQSGSAASGDIGNVKVYVDTVANAYPVTVSSDGKYYTANFGGILIDKGFSKEVFVRGDVADGSGRNIDFDVQRVTDIAVRGELYGYGITPSVGGNDDQNSSTDDSEFNAVTATPFYDGSQVTITGGSLTVEKAITVTAQNVAENVPDQVLGGFSVEVKGEAISVGQMDFYFDINSSAADSDDLTSVALYNASGQIVAGPVDGGSTNERVRFTDTVTFPVGKNVYSLKGKYGTNFANNNTVVASTTPSTDWSLATGQVSGNTITPTPAAAVTGNTMTVKAAALTISVSPTPVAQTVVAGNTFAFATYQLDTTSSGEDVRLNSIPLAFEAVTGTPTNLTGCTLYNGSRALNTGSNKVDPSSQTASSSTFTFDQSEIVAKGTITTWDLKCGTNATSSVSYRWGVDSSATFTVTGVTSGQSVTMTSSVNDSVGQLITLSTGGSYTVVNDSTPGYTIVTPGTESTLVKLKFSAVNESVDIKRVAFQLQTTASNTPLNLAGQKVTLWDGSTQVGEAIFANTGDYATSTLTGLFRVPAGSAKTLTVKGTIAGISHTVGPMTRSGDLLIVSYDGHDNNATTPGSGGNYGKGVSGGTDINTSTATDITPQGVRILKAYPSLAKIDLSSSERSLFNGSTRPLYKFSIKANGGDIALEKLSFAVGSSTKSATTSSFGVYAYTDSSFSNPDNAVFGSGLLNFGSWGIVEGGNIGGTDPNPSATVPLEIYFDAATGNAATTTYTIPSGETRWFALKATVSTVESGSGTESVEVSLLGDDAFPANAAMGKAGGSFTSTAFAGVGDDTNDDFIWSPISTSTQSDINDLDFTNGYNVPGLTSPNMSSEILTSEN